MGLDSVIAGLEKRFDKGCVMKMNAGALDVKTISTGSPSLDKALGGGFKVGGIIEIFGEEATGKTYKALGAAKTVQDNGDKFVIIDYEHALPMKYIEELGIDPENGLIVQPDDMEQGVEIMRALISSGEVALIIIDSVAAMTPRREIEGEVGEAMMGLTARLMSQTLRQVTGIASDKECTLVFINQLRDKLGAYVPTKVGSGGNGLKFYASQRIEVKKSFVRKDSKVIGFTQKMKVVKNKVAPAFAEAEIYIDNTYGACRLTEIIDLAIGVGIIAKGGAWFSYGEVKAQGKEKFIIALEEAPDVLMEVEEKVLASLKD